MGKEVKSAEFPKVKRRKADIFLFIVESRFVQESGSFREASTVVSVRLAGQPLGIIFIQVPSSRHCE